MQDMIVCSESARKQLLQQVQDYKKESGLDAYISLYVSEKGCAGMAYEMEFITKPSSKDYVNEEYKLCIRADSIMWLLGSKIDYKTTYLEEGFTFTNPQQKRLCHCGKAFYI